MSMKMSDFHGLSAMELPQGPRKPPSVKRTKSLDRSQNPKMDPESQNSPWISLPVTSSSRNNGVHGSETPAGSAEAQDSMAAVLGVEDAKKDKAQKQGWLKTFVNFILKSGPEEPKEKASKKAKVKEGLPQPTETPEAPAQQTPKKKAQDKKISRKKHSHKKHSVEETKEAQDQEAEGQEARLPQTSAASHGKEANMGPACREDFIVQAIVKHFIELADLREKENGPGAAGAASLIPQPEVQETLTIESGELHPSELCSGVRSLEHEEDLPLDKALESEDPLIKMIVDYIKSSGSLYDKEQVLVPQPAAKKKPHEKKTSLKRAFSYKKHNAEEPKRSGAAGAASLESRSLKKHSYLPTCVWGHQASVSSTSDLEEPEVQETLTTDGGGLHPSELCPGAGSQDHKENLTLDKSEDAVIQKIVEILIKIGDDYEKEQAPVSQPEVIPQNPAPATKKKPSEKKTTLKKGFSHKKHGAEEPKKAGAADAISLEARLPRRPSYLPLCVGGHRASVSSTSDLEDTVFQASLPTKGGRVGSSLARCQKPEEGTCQPVGQTIQKLHDLFQEVREELGEQIKQHPSHKRYFREILDSYHQKLVAILHSQETRSTVSGRIPGKAGQFLNLPDNFAGNNSHNVISLMDFAGQYGRRHSCSQFSYKEDQQKITSPDIQSPD
ncbi:protein BNIP5 isoform X2 [Erinaceus europaeus]|uniref:Protein BNIP5 isoform X2 n=1 Tax=Erinaceus europaeus TaxID=9365 RepID=A0ABM3XA51_ERIEU|nr:protein BNIP5 isoform X2 [Erinaceus europaeus]